MTSFKYNQNAALLLCGPAINLECCSDPTTYFDAMPCEGDTVYRKYCDDKSECLLGSRKYISYQARCNGSVNRVCECQRCTIVEYTNILAGQNDLFSINYTDGVNPGKLEFTDSSVIINDTTSILYENKTIEQLYGEINSANGSFIGSYILDQYLPSTLIYPTSYTFLGETKNIQARNSSLSLQLGDFNTGLVDFDTDPTIFAADIQTAINNMGLPAGDTIEFNYNAVFNSALPNNRYFEIIYKDNLCGLEQPYFSVDRFYLNYSSQYPRSPERAVSGSFGNYGDGQVWGEYGTITDYSVAGTGISDSTFSLDSICPYEKMDADGFGPFGYDGTQCCPQKGLAIGPNQYISQAYGEDNGYAYEGLTYRFDNLENTVLLGDCHSVDPFWFIFGKAGKFSESQVGGRMGYVASDCDWGNTFSNTCDVPTSCTPELFLTSFSQECPWGPFGSYFDGIEAREHVTNDGQPNEDAASISAWGSRYGYQYAPQGYIKTLGTWQETKKIEIVFAVRRGVPFVIGDTLNDNNLYAELDSATTTDFIEGPTEGPACGLTSLTYDCEGKTVGDFVDAINGLRTKAIDGGESCQIFNFCLASNDARRVPASKIINVNSEMWGISDYLNQNSGNPWDSLNGGGDPELVQNDSKLWSGSDIIATPKAYSTIWPYGGANIPSWNNTDLAASPSIRRPPYCNHSYGMGPKEDYVGHKTGILRRSPLWTSMQGGLETVMTLYKSDDIPSFITKIDVQATGRTINIESYSGTTLLQSTGILTDLSGVPFTVANCVSGLNNLVFTIGGTYHPIMAVSGSQPFTVWLDDSTYRINDVGGPNNNYPTSSGNPHATGTTYNWSYREVLENSLKKNLLSGPLDLTCWVRRRCDYRVDNLPSLNPCVPPNATTYVSSSKIDCDGDLLINANYIVGYGCTSGKCSKSSWYYKMSRCECSDQYDCGTRSFKPHITNQDGNNGTPVRGSTVQPSFSNNISAETAKISTPTLYICQSNIHPDCDIPMLVKVPIQIVGSKSDVSRGQCGASDIGVAYDASGWGDGITESANMITYRPQNNNAILGGSNYVWLTQINGGFPVPHLYSEMQGWCQYFDPSAGILVQKSNIPRTWPPTSYIADQGYPSFCSLNIYNTPDIINGNAAAGYTGWDEIQGVFPYVPIEYLGSWGSTCSLPPSFWAGNFPGLKALFRPIITDGSLLEISPAQAITNSQGDQRVDINCATKCCGGVYEECISGFTRFPWTSTVTNSYTSSRQGAIGCQYADPNCPGSFNPLCCTCRVGAQYPCAGQPICGISTTTVNVNSTKQFVSPCNCIDDDISGAITTSIVYSGACSNGQVIGGCTISMPENNAESTTVNLNCSNYDTTNAGNCTDIDADVCESDECAICTVGMHLTQNCDYTRTDGTCGAYSISGSETSTSSPTNTCPSSPAGINGCASITLSSSASSSTNATATTYTSCPGHTAGSTWSHIQAWKESIKWRCNVGNFMTTTNIGDSRLGDNICV